MKNRGSVCERFAMSGTGTYFEPAPVSRRDRGADLAHVVGVGANLDFRDAGNDLRHADRDKEMIRAARRLRRKHRGCRHAHRRDAQSKPQHRERRDKCELFTSGQRWTLRIQLPSAIPIEQKMIAVTNAIIIPANAAWVLSTREVIRVVEDIRAVEVSEVGASRRCDCARAATSESPRTATAPRRTPR